jgi:signal transduction histidine kinase
MKTSARLLIVEDDGLIATEMHQMLTTAGYEVSAIVASGERAVHSATVDPPDLVLMDITLPGGLDGIEAAAQIRAQQNIPIIYLTGHADTALIERAKVTEPFGYLLKPFQDKEVQAIIEMALYKHKMEIVLRETNQRLEQEISERKRAEEELRISHEQLRDLSAHLQAAREEERTRIAREIHDELGQILTALKMDLSWLSKKFTKNQAVLLEKAKTMEKLVDSTLKVVKRLATELRPGLLDDLGLSAAIEWQAEEFQQRTGIQCDVIIDPEDIIVKGELSTAVFRIFQETLTNVARHANATQIHVLLKEEKDRLFLEVRDNGKGITTKQISDPKSFGLIGIRERAQFLGGEVTFQGIPNQGTTVTLTIPL